MKMLRKFALSLYYRLRRAKKAFRNWRKFGVIIFGSIFLFSNSGLALSALAVGQGNLEYVSIRPTSVSLQVGEIYQFSGYAYDRLGSRLPERPALCTSNIKTLITDVYSSITGLDIGQSGALLNLYIDLIVSAVKSGDREQLTQLISALVQGINSELNFNINQDLADSLIKTIADKIIYLAKGVVLEWSVPDSKAQAGVIDGNGLFTAGNAPGTYINAVKLTASQWGTGSVSTFAKVTIFVKPEPAPSPQLEFVNIKPTSVSVKTGESYQFTAVARDELGNPIYSGIAFNWEIPASKQDAGSISDTGYFTAGDKPGTYINAVKVTASQEDSASVSSFAKVTVFSVPVPEPKLDHIVLNSTDISLDPGESFQFIVSAFDETGQPITEGIQFAWAVPVSAAGTITSNGFFTAGDIAGNYPQAVKVTASQASTGISVATYASVTVKPQTPVQELAYVSINPSYISLNPNEVFDRFTAVAYDADWQTITDGSVNFTWKVSTSGVGEITSEGVFTASAASGVYYGAVEVTATQTGVDSVSSFATVEILPPVSRKLKDVVINPSSAVVPTGDDQQFSAIVYDINGDVVTDPDLTLWWSLGSYPDTTWGIDSQTGLFHAGNIGYGSVTVSAYLDNFQVSASAAVTVVSKEIPGDYLSRVVISPLHTSLTVGESRTFSVLAYDGNNQLIDSSRWDSVLWSADSNAGNITQDGVFTAENSGAYQDGVTVAVTYRGATLDARASLTISEVTPQGLLDHVVINPSSASVAVNTSRSFTAYARDSQDNNINASYSWAILSGPGYLTNSASPTVNFHTENITGTALIQVTAYAGGLTADSIATVTVYNPIVPSELSYITISPSPAYVNTYSSVQFTARAFDTNGNEIYGPSFNWELGEGSIGTLTSSGFFRADGVKGTFDNAVRVYTSWNGVFRERFADIIVQEGYQPVTHQPNLYNSELTWSFTGTPAVGKVATYVLTVKNIGNGTAHNVLAKLDIPSELTFLSAYSSVDHPRLGSPRVIWGPFDVSAGQECVLTMKFLVKDLSLGSHVINMKARLTLDENSGEILIFADPLVVEGTQSSGGGGGNLTPTGGGLSLLWGLLLSAFISFVLTLVIWRKRAAVKIIEK